jgi:hypothetical protein
MLQTEGTDRRMFWWVLTVLAAIAGVATWNVLGAIAW